MIIFFYEHSGPHPQAAGAYPAIQDASVKRVLWLNYCCLSKASSKRVLFADVCDRLAITKLRHTIRGFWALITVGN